MSYSDIYLKSRSRPPAFLYVLAFLAVGGFAATFLRPSAPAARASKENVVYHTIANLSSHQAGVYYQTTNATPSWVVYGTNPEEQDSAAFDERDTAENKSPHNLHFVLLKDLQENTTYSYKIIADGEVVSVNNISTFTFTTPKTYPISNDSSINPAYGKVISENHQQVEDGIVLYYYPNAYPLVSVIRQGDWLIPLTSLIDRNTGKPLAPKSSERVKVEILNEDLKSTTFETVLANTTPLSKTVIIGTPFSEDANDTVLSAHVEVSTTPRPTAKATQLDSTRSGSVLEVTFPKDKAVIPGNNPLIKGKALPGSVVSATVRTSQQMIYSSKLTTDAQGEWRLSLPMALRADKYTLTVSTVDTADKAISVSRTFTTTKSGEEVVLGTATASATLTPSAAITSPAPTAAVITSTPVPTQPVVTTTPPVTGDNSTYIMIGSLVLVLIAVGVILFI